MIENLPLFSMFNDEEITEPCKPPKPPYTTPESHFAIEQKVQMCIVELTKFEQRVRCEIDAFVTSTGATNKNFKEAIQESYNAFQALIKSEINAFETATNDAVSLHISNIETHYHTLLDEITTACNSKINELEVLRVTLNNTFMNYRASLSEIVENFKTHVDEKIEEYKKYMVDNIENTTEKIFNDKARNGEISAIMAGVYGGTRTFKGSKSYAEIQAITDASNGDYYYCTSDGHFYQRTETVWVDIGNGDRLADDYETFKINATAKLDKMFNQAFNFAENLIDDPYIEKDYDGVETYIQLQRQITLRAGRYKLITPVSNTQGLMVSAVTGGYRIFQNKNSTTPKIVIFDVPTEYDNKAFYITVNISYDKPTTKGKYYAYNYLYKMDEDGNTSFDYMSENNLLTDKIVTVNNSLRLYLSKVSLNYNGSDLYSGRDVGTIKLPVGKYRLIMLNTNFKGVYITKTSNSNERLIAIPNIKEKNPCYEFDVTEDYANQDLTINVYSAISVPNNAGTYSFDRLAIYDYSESFLPDFMTRYNEIISYINALNPHTIVKNGYLSTNKSSLSSGETLEIESTVNVKKNKTLIFTGKISSFTGLRIGHGKTSYGGSYIEIDNTNVTKYDYYENAVKGAETPHGLTFDGFITVIITVATTSTKISIMTKQGNKVVDVSGWGGSNGKIFVESINSVINDCELKWTTADLVKPVWVFGDSYLGLSSESRFPYYLLQMGFNNWLASGYAGGHSQAELDTFKTLLSMGTPKMVVWCMGMNNGDNGAINTSWLNCVEELKTLCNDAKIELILSTIPSCPKVDNTYKNAYVKESGYRYVDFEKAVIADGSEWFDGMLSTDNVHPTALGAQALASRFVVDVPEIAQ